MKKIPNYNFVFDPETRIEYIVFDNMMCPRYNADGTVRLHPIEEWEELEAIQVSEADVRDRLPEDYSYDELRWAIDDRRKEILAERRAAAAAAAAATIAQTH